MRPCESHDAKAVRNSLVVSPTVPVKIRYAGVPAAAVAFDDQTGIRQEPVDPSGSAGAPRPRRLTQHPLATPESVQNPEQACFEIALRWYPSGRRPFLDE